MIYGNKLQDKKLNKMPLINIKNKYKYKLIHFIWSYNKQTK
jgi:hypothetical protein